MKAVVDENLHKSLAKVLYKLGFQIFDIRDFDLRGKSDDVIFRFAQKKKAILFSADLGFSNILRFPLGDHYGICILRFSNQTSTDEINERVEKLISKVPKKEFEGSLIIISPKKIRLRKASK